MFRSNQSLQNRKVIEVWGQSNTTGGSLLATDLPSQESSLQLSTLWARHSRHNSAAPDFEIDTSWGPVRCPNGPPNSYYAAGVPSYGLIQPLARYLTDFIPGLAILQCGYGGTPSAYWETAYPTTYAPWCAARYAQLSNPETVGLFLWQGESDAMGGTQSGWRARWETLIAARRLAVGKPNLPIVVVRLADTCTIANLEAMQAEMEALVAADPHATLITDNAMTFWGMPDASGPSLKSIARLAAAAFRTAMTG